MLLELKIVIYFSIEFRPKIVYSLYIDALFPLYINTEVVKVLLTPVSGQGGVLGTLTKKSTFPNFALKCAPLIK